MGKVLDQAVDQESDLTWMFQCPGVHGDGCGEPGGPGFISRGWPTKKAAQARGQQHLDEHKLGAEIRQALADNPDEDPSTVRANVIEGSEIKPMQELHEFRRDQGLTVNDDGSVNVEDL